MEIRKHAERVEYTRQMGPELGQLCHELREEYWWLVHKWHERRELYGRGQERIDLLNSVASNFFYFLDKLLFEDAMLHLCRLTDPPRSAGRDTLTIMRLSELVFDPNLNVQVKDNVATASSCCEFARQWRNQRLAHTDLNTLRVGYAVALPPVLAVDIERAIKSIDDVLFTIEEHHGQSHTILSSDPWGSKSLISHLEQCKKVQDREEASWRNLGTNGTLP